MKIAVIGAGAIGGLVAGYLRLKGQDISLLAHKDSVKVIKEKGLSIRGVRGDQNVRINTFEKLDFSPELVILATKTQDIDGVLKDNLTFVRKALVLTVQNGIRAEDIVARYVPEENIISSIVMFGATYLDVGSILHNFEGAWIIGDMFQNSSYENLFKVSLILDKAFPAIISENIKGMKYLKIFVNANNCIPAILGVSMQEAFLDLDISRISIAIWKEAFEIVSKIGIELVSLPGFPLENITKLISLPQPEAAKVFSGIMTKLSKEPLYGSILQSIKRGRKSEIDYINGEFTRIAGQNNLSAPLNAKLVEMVHEVEKTHKFFTKEELVSGVKNLINDN